ncbi:sodium:solute symporter family transporter [Erythrobacter dokdonensis]|uniref:SSS sodium solute transporter superfamily n=1 Tax=Erythrobacter dokdonensis DSW-74 TaxID=1300349 RepID=A0A1A7BCD9_9SPHN|nr:sodium/solute symporter [Erythrobacter dokdonensis]OBV10164.1 SSS sodium solute transporter superfamily [Erythrobacter dokdonensis DSW-74]
MFDAMPTGSLVQIAVCIGLTAAVGLATWLTIRRSAHDGSSKDVYLAGGKLSWLFVAGSITLTNLSTDQLVGMNGNQMALLAWWEICGFVGLMILAFVFVPIYYRNNCTTVTQLLEKRYGGRSIRTLISALFLAGNVLIYLPAALYSGSLFMRALFGEGVPLLAFAGVLAVISAAYTIFGGLRAVAVMDTWSGIGILGLAMLIVVLGLAAVDWDIVSGVPAERISMIGGPDSPIPWQTLLTGMIFIQIFYWSTNQNLTQKAMAAPTIREAQKGVLVAAVIRILIVPPIVVIPGIVAFKLFGQVGDNAYGMLVADILPPWLSGAFAAMVAAAVITTFSAVLNSSVALYAVDFHEQFIGEVKDHWKLSAAVSSLLAVVAIMLVPMYQSATSIINLLQQLNGLLSMPILSAFIAGLLFRGVQAPAAIAGVVWGVALYGLFTFWLQPQGIIALHYIHFMVVTLVTSVAAALAVNRFVLGGRAEFAPRAALAGQA